MNILYINHYAGSPQVGLVFRPYYMAKEWIKQGHQVCIVGGSYSHLRIQQPKVFKDCTIQTVDEVKYCWLKTPRYSSSGLKRFLSMIVFIMKLYRYKNKLIQILHPDVVIASSTYPIDIYPARYIAKKCNAKLCFQLHDLWPLSPMEIGGYSKYHPFIMLMQAGENYACKHSDVIVSVLGNAKQHLISHGMCPEKFHHVANGFSIEEWKDSNEKLPKSIEDLLEQLKKQEKFIIGYAGGIKPSNAMKTWVDAAMSLKENKRISFVSVGTGSELDMLRKYSLDNDLDNIYFCPSIEKKYIHSFLKYCDVLYQGGVHSKLHQHGISPIKIPDYMLAAKPIILSADVENEIVDRVGCGITVPAEDSEAVKNAILTLMAMSQEEIKQMGKRGQEYAFRELSYENLSQKFIQALS